MSQNSEDLRVRRTRKLLRDALIELAEERGFDSLTVGEIARRAMVSRAAFYRYYQDKYDLVEKIFEDAIETLTHDIDPLRRDIFTNLDVVRPPMSWDDFYRIAVDAQGQIPVPWVKLFEHFEEYERLYRVLLGKKGSSWFVNKMREHLEERANERLGEFIGRTGGTQRALAKGLVPRMIATQVVDTVTWWLEQGKPYSTSQIATYCFHLVYATLKEASSWK
ncbi:TetR/AcrR family transcriptional regulator [Dictyobacter aurantiacus]|uniref:TetR family transcriptional regulator n=1 Tax=Dictyobacter aurantiacus TaxID=1936993 RepID=A0A401ZL08_9CHLR|nr:TetR/AcrR family transcriptional regulator [Dictyobacter aurantiacus]GCE07549.1 TetR family transcriptional regulator [Dictyobacter aurantiacus]